MIKKSLLICTMLLSTGLLAGPGCSDCLTAGIVGLLMCTPSQAAVGDLMLSSNGNGEPYLCRMVTSEEALEPLNECAAGKFSRICGEGPIFDIANFLKEYGVSEKELEGTIHVRPTPDGLCLTTLDAQDVALLEERCHGGEVDPERVQELLDRFSQVQHGRFFKDENGEFTAETGFCRTLTQYHQEETEAISEGDGLRHRSSFNHSEV